MTDPEYRTEFAIWWIVQSPLVVDTDVRLMTPIMKELLLNEKMIEIHQDTRTPPGWHVGGAWWCGAPYMGIECQIWARKIFTPSWAEASATDAMVVVLLNIDDKNLTLSFDFEHMLWKEEYLPTGWDKDTVVVAEELMN